MWCMFKKTILLFCIVGFFHSTVLANTFHSDSTETSLLKFEAGFDMFFFLNVFRRTYSPEIETPIFSFTIIHHLEPEIEMRVIAGMGKLDYTIQNNSLPSNSSNTTSYRFRFGLEKEVFCNNRWMFFYGADMFFNKDLIQTIQPSGSEIITDNQNNTSYGIVPLAGVKYFITPRIILSTEMDFYISYFYNSDNSSYKINPKENSSLLSHGFNTSFFPPNDINLLFIF